MAYKLKKEKPVLPDIARVNEGLKDLWFQIKGQKILDGLPKRWREKVEGKYHASRYFDGIETANSELQDLEKHLHEYIDISANDSDLQKLAEKLAKKCELGLKNVHVYGAGLYRKALMLECEKYQVRYPIEHDCDFENVVIRLVHSAWWLRQLRKSHAKARESAAIDARMVHRKADLYVSDDTLDRRIHQIRRNDAHLRGVTLESESGLDMTLEEISSKTNANPFIRATELVVRARGYEETAKANKHKCVFVTITTPPRMHAIGNDGKPNKSYDGTKPNDAQAYLVRQWARCRARLAREHVDIYGLRVAEPHHDATPHWHMTLFFKDNEALTAIKNAINHYFLHAKECDGGAFGSKQNRIKYMLCDGRGATGYILKYIMKNMRGFGIKDKNGLIESDYESEGGRVVSSELSTNRVEAWASTWAIRQFQAIGGHSVTVWRELRRFKGDLLSEAGAMLKSLMWAVNKQDKKQPDFSVFIHAIGGAFVKRKDANLRLDVDYIDKEGRYGLAVQRVIKGVFVVAGGVLLSGYREAWQIKQDIKSMAGLTYEQDYRNFLEAA